MTATTPATLAALGALRSTILTASGSAFAQLSAADAVRYGVARAVFIGAPLDIPGDYLPQCQLLPEAGESALTGETGRVSESLTVNVRILVDATDWWAGEQQLLALRDQLVPALLTTLRAGAVAGGALVALGPARWDRQTYSASAIGGVSYRIWSTTCTLWQHYTPPGGLAP